ncbi:MAG: outer membrane beta-barrel protein, partial [Thermonemataceae bacterium]
MLQKKLLLTKLFIFGLTLLTVQAQTHQVQGEIVTVHQQAIPFATVGILKAEDSTLIKAAVTDDNGKFSFNNIENGKYRVMVNSMGFGQYYSSTFQVAGQDKQLATITLQEKEGLLEEVEVTAQKPLVEVLSDKMVFNVQDNIAATGTSAFELLRKVPGVIMDNNNQLLVEGKTGVLIFINGKQSFLEGDDLNNFLQSLQASDIEAIEVITQPSSKYDAAGAAGILNIRLKKDKGLGTNGTVNVGYSQWDNVRYNSALSVNNRTKYTNTFLNYSNRFGATNNFIDLYRLQNDFIFDAQSEGIRDVNTHNVRMGSDWFTSDKSTFGVLFSGNFGNTRANTDSNTPILDRGTGNLLQLLVAESNALSTYSNMLGNLNYRFEDTLGRSFNVDVDYGAYSRTRNNEQPNFYFGGDNALQSQFIYDMDTPTDIRIFTFKSDYEQPFWKGKLGTGVKVSVINTDNTFDFYEVIEDERILDEDRSNTFAYEEGIYAAYLNFSRKWKK